MAMNFCLPRDRVEAFTEGLRNGEINPDKLMGMTSKERGDFLGKYVGEGAAKRVNAEFESKTLLKNQQQGMITWAKNVTGIKPAVRRDLVEKIKNLDKVLDPKEKEEFLGDLVSVRLGTDVTQEEAKTIATMSQSLQDAKAKMSKDYTFPTEEDRLNYGRSVVRMEEYVKDLKVNAGKFRAGDLKTNPIGTIGKGINFSAGLAKSITASLDNSVIGRQGLKILFTHPKLWLNNSAKTFVDQVRTWGGKEVMQEVRAEIASRPNALNGLYKREKLALPDSEEAYPTSLPEKIPVVGRLFKGSETAYTAFALRTRADLMDKFAELAEKTGGDIKGMGLVANSLTGRGTLPGVNETGAKALNNLFFSPRFLKSNIDALTGQVADYGKLGTLAKKEAAKNTLKIIGGIATILGTAEAISPTSVDLDPRSTDFGKIKVGDTRFDVSGGMSSIATLAARFLTEESKSSSGVITKLNEGGFNAKDLRDLLTDFLSNKLSPAARVFNDVKLRGQDFNGDKPTLQGEAKGLLLPIGFQNYEELKDNPRAADTLLAMIADGLGIGTNTFGSAKKDSWKNTTSKELLEFKNEVGDDKFKAANKQADDTYNTYVDKVSNTDKFKSLSQEDKTSLLNKKKTQIQKDVLSSNGFEYVPPEKDEDRFGNLLD